MSDTMSETSATVEEDQIGLLANYIMSNIPGEPSQSEGAGSTAVRIMVMYRRALRGIMDELGVLQPVINAYEIAKLALNGKRNT